MEGALIEFLRALAIMVVVTYAAAIAVTLIAAPFVWAWGLVHRWKC